MKKLLLFTVYFYLLISSLSVKSQEQEIGIDSLLSNIDKTTFTSGILYDRVVPWSGINTFNEKQNISALKHFEQALNELYKASNMQKFISHKSLRPLYITENIKNKVDIGIINASFHQVNYNLENENEGALRFNQDKFEKINNNKQAFIESHVLIIAPLKEYLVGNDIIYNFNNAFLLENTNNKNIQSITANFDTQNDYTIFENGSFTQNTLQIHYNEEGYKILTFTTTFTDGTTKTTQGTLHVKFAQQLPPQPLIEDHDLHSTIPFQGYNETSSINGYMEYRIFYHTSNNNNQATLLKPIIIIDGFDPGDKRKIQDSDSDKPASEHLSIEEMMVYLDSLGDDQSIIQILRDLGYDVIIVNHPTYTASNGVEIDGGADYIERNALTHVTLYQHLNAILAQNGSTEELVIVGPSMGGQISRYALAYMEANNITHNTRLWVSIDSPHLGANIPIGIQALINLLDVFGDSNAAEDFYFDELKSVASNQQLIEQHLEFHLPDHLNNGSPVRQQYHNNLFSNGLPNSDGYPQNLRKIAIVNGSLKGINVGVASEEDFRIHGFLDQGWWDIKVVEMSSKYMPSINANSQVARLWRKWKPLRTANYTNINPRGTMDIVPGGLFNSEDQLHASVLGEGVGIVDWGNGVHIMDFFLAQFFIFADHFESRENKEVHSFIPTVSALGFKNPNFNWSQELNRNLACTDEIPFDSYFGPRNNERHTSFTEESVNWLLEELDGNPQPPTVYLDTNDLLGSDIVCSGDIVTYDFGNCKVGTPVQNWIVSNGLQILSSNGSSVTVESATSTNNPGFIKAVFPTYTVEKDIWLGKPHPPSYLNGPEIVSTGAIVTYSGGIAEGATSYDWWLPFPYDVVAPTDYFSDNWQTYPNMGRNNSHVFTGYSGNSGYVQLMGVNSCGNGSAEMIYVEHGSGGGGDPPIPVVPYPNTADTDFKLDFTTYPEGTYYIFIYDIYSNIIYQGSSQNVNKTVDTVDIPNGLYYLHIHDGNEVVMKQLIIEL